MLGDYDKKRAKLESKLKSLEHLEDHELEKAARTKPAAGVKPGTDSAAVDSDEEVPPPAPVSTKRRSRRRRDYWLLMLAGNAVFVAFAGLLPTNIMAVAYSLLGAVIYSAGLTWVMFGVLDDY